MGSRQNVGEQGDAQTREVNEVDEKLCLKRQTAHSEDPSTNRRRTHPHVVPRTWFKSVRNDRRSSGGSGGLAGDRALRNRLRRGNATIVPPADDMCLNRC